MLPWRTSPLRLATLVILLPVVIWYVFIALAYFALLLVSGALAG